jgi:hypothetical protein
VSNENGLAANGSAPLVLHDGVIEGTAAEIRDCARAAKLEFASKVGRIVLERFYGGDVAAWHSHGRKDASLRKLADRLEDAHLSASALYRCVAIHAALQALGPLEQWHRVAPTHVSLVLPLPPDDQAALLREVEENGWSVDELKQRVRATKPVKQRGRPLVPAFAKAIRKFQRMFSPDGEAFQELGRAEALSPEDLDDLSHELMQGREQAELLQRTIVQKRAASAGPKRQSRRPLSGGKPRRPPSSAASG